MSLLARWLLVLALPFGVGLMLHAARQPLTAPPHPAVVDNAPRGEDDALPAAPALRLPSTPPPLSYRIEATLQPAQHRIAGKLRLRFVQRAKVPLSELRLHLYLQAFSSDKTRFMKSSGGVHRGNRMSGRGGSKVESATIDGKPARLHPLHDGTVLAIQPAAPLTPGATVELSLRFVARLPRISARMGYAGSDAQRAFFMIAQWFPKLGVLRPDGSWHAPPFHAHDEFFADFARYRVRFSLPAHFRLGHTGRRLRVVERGGQRIFELAADWVHDFALAAWPAFVEHRLRVGKVALRLLTVPGRGHAARELALLRFGLKRLSRWFGAYPYAQLTVVDVPARARGAGAMEYPQLFTVWFPKGLPAGVRSADEVLLHELTHQYFQGLVATNEVDEPWLDEGLTTFVSGLLADARFGRDRSTLELGPLQLGQREKNQLHQASLKKPVAVAQPAAAFFDWDAYGPMVYGRTAALLYATDSLLGRRHTIQALRRYVQRHAFGHPTRADLWAAWRQEVPPAKLALVTQLWSAVLDGDEVFDADLRCEKDALRLVRRGKPRLPVGVVWCDASARCHHVQASATSDNERIAAPGLRHAWLTPRARLLLDGTPIDRRCSVAGGGQRAVAWHLWPLLQLLLQLAGS